MKINNNKYKLQKQKHILINKLKLTWKKKLIENINKSIIKLK